MSDLPVDAFLAPLPEPRRRVAELLRSVVRRAVPGAIERVRVGWRLIGYDLPVEKRTAYFAFIAPEANHVHLGFEHGVAMDDPDGVLRGDGLRQVRYVTLIDGDEVPPTVLEALIREGARVATMSRAERVALILGRDA